LPPGKACGLASIGINPRKFLPVGIVNGYLPMSMLATPVFAQCGAFFDFLQGFVQLWVTEISQVLFAAASTC
jgi:hypothetical protein